MCVSQRVCKLEIFVLKLGSKNFRSASEYTDIKFKCISIEYDTDYFIYVQRIESIR